MRDPRKNHPLSYVIASPKTILGVDLGNILPDLAWLAPTGGDFPGTLPNVVKSEAGMIGAEVLRGARAGLVYEAKSGYSASGIGDGVDQAERYAKTLKTLGLTGRVATVLAVDQASWNSLTPSRKANYYRRMSGVGAYIQVVPDLAKAADSAAAAMVQRAESLKAVQ
jgi:hypothetical protein